MMRLLKSAVLAAALLLTLSAGMCEGVNTAELIAKVQDTTKKACGFMPIASTVAAILDTMATGGAATAVATAANGICAAVKPSMQTLRQVEPEFNGVKIEGEFVNP